MPEKFYLRVYDNFHYMDESEAYNHGQFETYEEALAEAQKIVDEFFEHNWEAGVTSDYLQGLYTLYGEDPVILPNEPGKNERFSAWTYARVSAEKACRKMENK